MKIVSTQKYIVMSPEKIRVVVAMIKGTNLDSAIETLRYVKKNAAEPLRKVLMSAKANALNRGVSETDLTISEIQVGEGPRYKRGRAVSRGRWHPFKKRTSHIRVVLTDEQKKVVSEKEVAEKTVKKVEKIKDKIEVVKKVKVKRPKKGEKRGTKS